MFIEHIAIWCTDLEKMKDFYCRWFGATSNNIYHNISKQYSSYFLSFAKGPRLELMQMTSIPENVNDILKQYKGLIHFAVSAGSAEKVDRLTNDLRQAGCMVIGGPRTTGDGYYESVIFDIDGNKIEITE